MKLNTLQKNVLCSELDANNINRCQYVIYLIEVDLLFIIAFLRFQ